MPSHTSSPHKQQAAAKRSSQYATFGSITGVHTKLLTLSPAFHEALKKVAPKKRAPRGLFVVLAALVAIAAFLAVSRPHREQLVSTVRHFVASLR